MHPYSSPMGLEGSLLTYRERNNIALAVCRQVAFDFGFTKDLVSTRMTAWYGGINKSIRLRESQHTLSPSWSRSVTYVFKIEKTHPGYLHELFRNAQRILGGLATYQKITDNMNEKSAMPGEQRATITLTRKQLSEWFCINTVSYTHLTLPTN